MGFNLIVEKVVYFFFFGHIFFLEQKSIECTIIWFLGGGAPLALPKIRKNPLVEIIAINTGCLNACTYCKTKHARGQLGSYTIDEIVQRAQQAFEVFSRTILKYKYLHCTTYFFILLVSRNSKINCT